MKCPTCAESGLKSRVYETGAFRTAMAVSRYWDEDGKLVVDDPNTTTTSYRCSNGHEWSEAQGPTGSSTSPQEPGP